MRDKQVELGCLVAYGLWLLSVGLTTVAAVMMMTAHEPGEAALAFLGYGLVSSAAAATATIRRFFIAQTDAMRQGFELGRDWFQHPQQQQRGNGNVARIRD